MEIDLVVGLMIGRVLLLMAAVSALVPFVFRSLRLVQRGELTATRMPLYLAQNLDSLFVFGLAVVASLGFTQSPTGTTGIRSLLVSLFMSGILMYRAVWQAHYVSPFWRQVADKAQAAPEGAKRPVVLEGISAPQP